MKHPTLSFFCVLACVSSLPLAVFADPIISPAAASSESTSDALPSELVPQVTAPVVSHIFWTSADGRLSLWNYSDSGAFTQMTYGPYPGWTPKAIADGPDGRQRILWTSTNGTASIWSLDNTTGTFTQHSFGPYAGWAASALSIASTSGTGVGLTGTAGGDLFGTYPNPTVAPNVIDHTKLAFDAASLSQVTSGSMSISSGNISVNAGKYLGPDTTDLFTYQGKSLGNASLGWFSDSTFGDGSAAWLSGWADIKLFTASTARLTIDHYGNIGIGTETPQTTLDVNGGLDVHDFAASGGATVAGVLHVGGDFVLNGRGGGAGNNGNAARALVDNGGGGLYVNYNNDFGRVVINSDAVVTGIMTANSLQLTGGSDLAEPYKIAASADVQPLPGMVVAIDPDQTGQMRVCSHAYDPTVGGIISGAGGVHPGITLRQAGTVADGTLPIACTGRVWCWCDADASGAITPGDLLTTSNTPGHAMRVRDYDRAHGAIIGKAMSTLKTGKGLVLVLVSLQ